MQLDQKNVVASLLEKANKYRELARWVTDSETVQRILSLAEELKQRARAMAKPSEDQIRKRAQERWERAGKPDGRDEEFGIRPKKNFRERMKNRRLSARPTTCSLRHAKRTLTTSSQKPRPFWQASQGGGVLQH